MKASFVYSFNDVAVCPKDDKPEFAFIGRSNVGKSSLVNYLFNDKNLAKVSGTPGKTQTLNYFDVDNTWYAVDLPGYGFAKVSQSMRKKWKAMINAYLLNRPNMQCIFVLLDSNIPYQKLDKLFLEWLADNQLPFALIMTKCDRSSKIKLEYNVKAITDEIQKDWEELPTCFLSSADRKKGKDEIIAFIEDIVNGYYEMLGKPKKK
jgi:GTP-binding protein